MVFCQVFDSLRLSWCQKTEVIDFDTCDPAEKMFLTHLCLCHLICFMCSNCACQLFNHG